MTPTKTKKTKRKPKGAGAILRRGKTWAIRFVDHGTRRYEGGFATESDARQALDVRRGDLLAGRIGKAPSRARQTLSDRIGEFWASRDDDEHRSLSDDKYRWTNHLEPVVGALHFEQVDDRAIDRIVARMTNAPGSKRHVLALLSSLFRWNDRKAHNPVRDYLSDLSKKKRKTHLTSKHDPKDTPFLPKAHWAAVFHALPAPVDLAFAISAMAGLRPGEVQALEWADINLLTGKIHVQRQVRHGKLGPPKNGKPRLVDIVPGLATILRQRQQPEGLVIPPHSYYRNGIKGRARGRYLNWRTIDQALEAAFASLGLAQLTLYQAGRHSYASNWVLSGLDIYRLSEQMGHSSVLVTSRYAHLGTVTPPEVLAKADVDMSQPLEAGRSAN